MFSRELPPLCFVPRRHRLCDNFDHAMALPLFPFTDRRSGSLITRPSFRPCSCWTGHSLSRWCFATVRHNDNNTGAALEADVFICTIKIIVEAWDTRYSTFCPLTNRPSPNLFRKATDHSSYSRDPIFHSQTVSTDHNGSNTAQQPQTNLTTVRNILPRRRWIPLCVHVGSWCSWDLMSSQVCR
jgi:hypothetical protein